MHCWYVKKEPLNLIYYRRRHKSKLLSFAIFIKSYLPSLLVFGQLTNSLKRERGREELQ